MPPFPFSRPSTESESGVLRELELGCILWCLNIHTSAGLEVERAEAEARQDFAKTNENLLRRKLQFVFQEINSAYQLKFTVRYTAPHSDLRCVYGLRF